MTSLHQSNNKHCIAVALKTVQYKVHNGLRAEQAIKVSSFIGFVNYLNRSKNWIKDNDNSCWRNISGQLIITNSVKGFILHRIH